MLQEQIFLHDKVLNFLYKLGNLLSQYFETIMRL